MTTRKPIRRMTQIQTTKKRTSQNPYKELTNSLIRGGCVSQAHFRVLRLLFFARFFLLHDEYNKVSMWQFTGENRESLGTVN